MEMTKDESKRILRRIELEAYSALVTALRAQGELDREKKRLLRELGEQLSISTERHRAEIRRAISDDRLSMIAECVCGSDAAVEWESEGRRVVPLMPRLVPQTAFTGVATAAANHAASVNSTISSSIKEKTRKREEDDMKARKRQKTTSPKPVQKVIVSSIPRSTSHKETISTVTSVPCTTNTPKEPTTFSSTTSLPTKQENSSSPIPAVSMKLSTSNSGSSGQQISSKPIILGGSKQASSVSMATSKHVAPLPASCLQAHASVVSSNKNKAKLNLVKQKPKPKFKPLTAAVKPKTVTSSNQGSQPTSILSSPSPTDKSKANETSTVIPKPIQVPRSSSSISVSPKSSISLTTLKTTLQQKSKPQSPPGTVRAADTTSRQATGQLSKGASVTRLPRPLPIILPKSLPPKPNIPRRLASILPAPVKTTTTTVTKQVILPAAASTVSSTTSSPIPIAPLPRPPNSLHGPSSTVKSATGKAPSGKVPAVSLTTGPSNTVKRDNREACSTSELVAPSPALPETVGSLDSSQSLCNKPAESIHERGTLSPVSEILTLVTSPSSVPFVPSSPVKSKPLTTVGGLSEVSLKCDETLSEVKDFLKEEEIELKGLTSHEKHPAENSADFNQQSTLGQECSQNSPKPTANDALQTLNEHDDKTLDLDNQRSYLCSDKCDVQSALAIVQSNDGDQIDTKPNELTSSSIDLSPLVDELLSSRSVVTKNSQNEGAVNVSSGTQLINTGVCGSSVEARCKNVESCPSMDISLSAVKDDQCLDNVIEVDVGLEKVEDNSDLGGADAYSASSEKRDTNPSVLAADSTAKLDETDIIVDQEEIESKTVSEKVVALTEDAVEIKDKNSSETLLCTGKDNMDIDIEKSSMLKNEEKSKELVSSTTEPNGKLKESGSVTDYCVNVVTVDQKGLEETVTSNSQLKDKGSPLKNQLNPDQMVIQGTEPLELSKTQSSKCQDDEDQTILYVDQNVEKVDDTFCTEHGRSALPNDIDIADMYVSTTESELRSSTAERVEVNDSTKDAKDEALLPTKDVPLVDEMSCADGNESDIGQSSFAVSSTSPITSGRLVNASDSQAPEEEVEKLSRGDKGGRQESIEEQLSGSDTSSCEGVGIRTSGRKRKAPPPRDLNITAHPPGWIRGALYLLQRVSRFRGNSRSKGEPSASSWFIKPVEPADAPGYHKIIKHPMDFGTIKSKLETAEYSDHTQFHDDMLLVKTNCYKYNPPGHDVRRDCDEVFQFYEAEYEKFAEKLEKCHLSSAKKPRSLFGGNELK